MTEPAGSTRWVLLDKNISLLPLRSLELLQGYRMITSDQSEHDVLEQTLRRFVVADARITQVASAPLAGGMSGSAVARHTVRYTTASGTASATLITKDTDVREWRVLQHLQSQGQPNIPFAHTIDRAHGERLRICLQDLGDQHRPTSLEPITATELALEAAGLAIIHSANFGQQARLDWLPAMTPDYVEEMLFVRAWRPAWERAVADARFAAVFREALPRVESAAATIVDDLRMLLDDPTSQTLIHADLNPSNVLVHGDQPYFIDWQTAMRGPFYIDLPHHHCTLVQAEHYRQALAVRGHMISREEFAERYRLAARYIGLRYMWWTLDYWLEDQTQTAWVQHYINLITGDGIGAGDYGNAADWLQRSL